MSERELRGFQGRVIKWDGELPPDADPAHPEAHPACAEIVAFDGTTGLVNTLYKRGDSNGTH